MSKSVERAPTPANSIVQNTVGKGRERRRDVHSRIGLEGASRRRHADYIMHASAGRATKNPDHRRKEVRNLVRSYVTCSSERQREIEREWDTDDQASHEKPTQTVETYLSEGEHDRGGHLKSKSKKKKLTDEEDKSQPWLCEETDPFTTWIRNFEVPKRTCMPTNVKTYDGTGDPEDHLKIFQTAAKIE
ncbi:hypothetical protein Tco_0781592 [Tanacetum coccineum]